MSDSQVQQNLLPSDPKLADLLKLFKKDILLNFNSHHIVKIQSFNAENQTASATVNYKKTFFLPNPVSGVYQSQLRDYPVLLDCPVIFLGGGNGALTFPVAVGDDALALFNDRDLDKWMQGSSTSPVSTPRLHSYSDGIILVGLRSLNDSLVDFNGTDIEIRTKDGTTKVSVNTNGEYIRAKIGDAITFEVNSDGKFSFTNAGGEFLSALIDMLTQAYTITMLGNQPLVFPADKLAIVEGFKI